MKKLFWLRIYHLAVRAVNAWEKTAEANQSMAVSMRAVAEAVAPSRLPKDKKTKLASIFVATVEKMNIEYQRAQDAELYGEGIEYEDDGPTTR
jgi:hypothetical protein